MSLPALQRLGAILLIVGLAVATYRNESTLSPACGLALVAGILILVFATLLRLANEADRS